MTRYGALTVQFYSPALALLGSKEAVSATFRERVNGEGEARITFVNDSDLSTWGAVGNIAWAWKTDALRTDTANGIVVCEPFTIARRATIPGSDFLEISGPDLLSELKRYTIYRPLGELVEYSTNLSETPRDPTTTTTNGAFSAGSKFIDVAANGSNSADKTREIRIALNTSPATTHVTVVEDRLLVDSGGTQKERLVLRDRLPAAVANGAAVEMRTRVIKIADTSGFRDGIEVEVTLDNDTTHTTLMLDEPEDAYITLRDGLPSKAVQGINEIVKAKAYTGKSAKDVKTVLTYATGWSGVFDSTYEGTAAGTVYQGGGETVYNVLRAIADETGEFFRLRSAEIATRGPKREVRWLRTNPAAGVSGGTLRLVMPDDANMASDTANMNRAIMLRRPEFVGEYEPVTQLIPVAGDAAVTLFSCSTSAVAAAAAEGFTVVRTGLGLYTPPYIDWTSQTSAIGVHQRRVTFSEVTIDGTGADQVQAAADKLLRLSIKYMKARRSTARTLMVECVSPVGIRPGDTVELYYRPSNAVYTLNYVSGQSEPKLYVQEVERTVGNSGDYPGVPVTRLMLSPTPEAPEQGGNREAARRLVTVERLAAQVNTPRSVNISVPSPGGYAPPATISATTPNETTGSGHTHQVTAAVSGLSGAGQLVKTDSAGSVQFNQARVRSLWIGNPDDRTYVDFRQQIHDGIAYLVGSWGTVGSSETEEV